MSDTALPSASTAHRYTVSLPLGSAPAVTDGAARRGSTARRRSAMNASESSASTGTRANSGSATWRCVSAKASFMHSICRWSASAEPAPVEATSNPSRRRSAMSAARPCPFGGCSHTRRAAVRRLDRLAPRGLLARQVVHRPARALRVHEGDERLADRALVERVRRPRRPARRACARDLAGAPARPRAARGRRGETRARRRACARAWARASATPRRSFRSRRSPRARGAARRRTRATNRGGRSARAAFRTRAARRAR